MESISPEQLRTLWILLAGFILGFATSTLWEWLFYRGRRVDRLEGVDRDEFSLQADPENSGMLLERDSRTQQRAREIIRRTHPPVSQAATIGDMERETLSQAPIAPVHAPPLAAAAPAATSFVSPNAGRTPQAAPDLSAAEGVLRAEPASESAAFSATMQSVQAAEPVAPAAPPLLSLGRGPLPGGRGMQPAAPGTRPLQTLERSQGFPDDLTQIPGLTKTHQQRLYEAQIFTWHQVSTSDLAVLRKAARALPEVNVDEWPRRAAALARRNQRINAAYSGPQPDDLTQIRGIGLEHASTLNRAGICSFAQLADCPRSELVQLLSSVGAEVPEGVDGVLRTAQQLAQSMRKLPRVAD